jgi:hypothetical protein
MKQIRTPEELDADLKRQLSILKDQYAYSSILTKFMDKIEAMRPYAIFDVSLFPPVYKGVPIIEFIYCGCAKTEEEGRSDLADIMRINKVIFEDLSYAYDSTFHEHGYAGEYRGDGRWDDQPIGIKLIVPWLPVGCEIKWTTPEEPFRQIPNKPQATLVCAHE